MIRTDLALEAVGDIEKNSEKIVQTERGKNFSVTEIFLKDDSFLKSCGKPRGRYITLSTGSFSRFSENYENIARELSAEIASLVPDGDVFIAGLGNRDITPDAVGPLVVSEILATRHLKDELTDEDIFLKSLRKTSTLAGGVLGQTGIESAEIIKAVCGKINPSAVIVVDALACSDVNRLGSTIQLTDTGISPGSGVANSRKEISKKTVGVPVIAVGIPTVIDIHTVIKNLGSDKSNIPQMMVTPRDIDCIVQRSAHLISDAINLAMHPSLSLSEINSLF